MQFFGDDVKLKYCPIMDHIYLSFPDEAFFSEIFDYSCS